MSGWWIALIVVGSLAWWASGTWGFIYWWTNEFDLKSNDLVFGLFMGYLGPVAWLVGHGIHGRTNPSRVLKARRQ